MQMMFSIERFDKIISLLCASEFLVLCAPGFRRASKVKGWAFFGDLIEDQDAISSLQWNLPGPTKKTPQITSTSEAAHEVRRAMLPVRV